MYTHNVRVPLDIELKVSTADEYDKSDSVMSFALDSESEVLDLKEVSKDLCKDKMA